MMLPLSSTESGRLAIVHVFSGGDVSGVDELFTVRYLEELKNFGKHSNLFSM